MATFTKPDDTPADSFSNRLPDSQISNPPTDGGSGFQQWINNLAMIPQSQIESIRESCPFITLTHGVIGFGFGAIAGLFFASMGASSLETSSALGDRNPLTGELYASTSVQVRAVFKDMLHRTYSSAKSFGKIAMLFSASECVIEGVPFSTNNTS